MGAGRNFFLPCFFYLSQKGVSLLCQLTLFCSDKILAPEAQQLYRLTNMKYLQLGMVRVR